MRKPLRQMLFSSPKMAERVWAGRGWSGERNRDPTEDVTGAPPTEPLV
jgi:hypothetical protein